MDPSSLRSQVTATLNEYQTLRRRAQAANDVIHLSLISLDKQNVDWSIVALIVKADLCADDKSPEEVACVVCGGVPVTEWTALGFDPDKAGLHCAAHKAAFHSICKFNYNCCDEPYDPDNDYERRARFEPQEIESQE